MLMKQEANINFGQGLDTKSDPFQVPAGKFLALNNSIFTKAGLLQKRNGFGLLSTLPNASSIYCTSFNNALVAVGSSLETLSSSTNLWSNKGNLALTTLSTLPLIRSSNNQSQCDSVTASNGLICTVYTDNPASGTAYDYVITDSTSGAVVYGPASIVPSAGVVSASPRVFFLAPYFIIVFGATISGVKHVQYVAIPISNPSTVSTAIDIASAYVSSPGTNYDGIVANGRLFLAYNTTTGGQAVKVTYLTPQLGNPFTPISFSVTAATFSMCADMTNPSAPIVYITVSKSAGGNATNIFAVNYNCQSILGVTLVVGNEAPVANIASVASNGVCTVYLEINHTYLYDSSIKTNYIYTNTISQGGIVGGSTTLVRSVGLGSKAVLYNSVPYFLGAYSSTTLINGSYQDLQPSYFLLNGNTGAVVGKLAYTNGGGLLTVGLPALNINGTSLQTAYLIKDLVASANKGTNVSGVPLAAVYSQTGVNQSSFNLSPLTIDSSEIGNNLNITGGIITAFDGVSATEQGFNLWPDSVEVTTSTSGGLLADTTYYYQVCYEWADNNGNVFRSAPSVPVKQVTSGGNTSSNSITVPCLRLTYKTNVKIVVYRWSLLQQVYYSITSPAAAPVLSDPTTDYITIVDTLADASIIGNPILYTTGGVIENIGAPASNLMTLFNNRLFMVDAEDTNLLWYSKQVIEATPVEMSDLLTIYVAPTTGAQGSTGPITALAPMDDKLVVFKKDAAYYISGTGPDNTGSNSQYSDATFISSVVGCANQNSIIFIPNGLMFQSDKGIWLLGRDLSTSYIGAPVENYTQNALVKSALVVPGTNQVRFTMDSGVTLMYDYYFQQWGAFTNIPAVSSTIYQGLHTYINSLGQVLQETPGLYLDNSNPVLLSFTTSWFSLAGLQGFERFYQALLLGQYYTPFKLNVQFAFDYSPNPQQSVIVKPDNYSPPWGGNQLWGSGTPWGGPSQAFKARIFPSTQKVETFQLIVNEIYDPSFGVQAGAGLTLSGMALTVGVKKGRRTQSNAKSFG